MKHRTDQLIVLTILTFVALTASAAIEIPNGFEPVPASQINVRALTVPALNFSIEAPEGGWIWFKSIQEPPESQSFLCFKEKKINFFLTVTHNSQEQFNESVVDKALSEITAQQEKNGWIVSPNKKVPSSIPLPGSYQANVLITAPNRTKVYLTMYLAHAGEFFYYLGQNSLQETENPEFRNFVASFRLLGEPAKTTPPGRSSSNIERLAEKGDMAGLIGYIMGLLILPILLVVWLVSRRKGKSKSIAPLTAQIPRLGLSFYNAAGQVQTQSYTSHSILVGSDPECDLQLPNLKPFHCRLYLAQNGYYAEDLGGIQINQISGAGYIKNGDVLQLWEIAFRVSIE